MIALNINSFLSTPFGRGECFQNVTGHFIKNQTNFTINWNDFKINWKAFKINQNDFIINWNSWRAHFNPKFNFGYFYVYNRFNN